MTCANDHAPIQHEEFYCPLCCEIADRNAEFDLIESLKETNSSLSDYIEELCLADVVKLFAEIETLEQEAYATERQLHSLRHSVRYTRRTPMGRYIETVQRDERTLQ